MQVPDRRRRPAVAGHSTGAAARLAALARVAHPRELDGLVTLLHFVDDGASILDRFT